MKKLIMILLLIAPVLLTGQVVDSTYTYVNTKPPIIFTPQLIGHGSNVILGNYDTTCSCYADTIGFYFGESYHPAIWGTEEISFWTETIFRNIVRFNQPLIVTNVTDLVGRVILETIPTSAAGCYYVGEVYDSLGYIKRKH